MVLARGVMDGHSGGRQPAGRGNGPRQAWQDWLELTVALGGLPWGTTILHVWQALEGYGRIKSIKMPKSNTAARGHAYVTFSPVPQTPFWTSGRVDIVIDDVYPVCVSLQKNLRADSSRVVLRLLRLDFGIMLQEHHMDIMKTVQHETYYPTLTANLDYKRLEVQFTCFIPDPRRDDPTLQVGSEGIGKAESLSSEYKAEIGLQHLKQMYQVDVDKDHWCLVIPLQAAPKFWKSRRYVNFDRLAQNARWGEPDRWVRTGDITYADWAKDYPVSFQEPFSFIEIGKWTTYRLVFRRSEAATWGRIKSILQNANVQVLTLDSTRFTWKQGEPLTLRKLLDVPQSNSLSADLALLHDEGNVHLPFDIRYQLEAAISERVFVEQSITTEFLRKLLEQNKRFKNKAKNMLEYVTNAGKRIYNPMTIFDNTAAKTYYTPVVLPEHCTWVRKVTVTPSTIYVSSPVQETTNRVLRRYASDVDRFIRVQFMDERTEGRLYPHPNGDMKDGLFNRVFRTLRHGIVLGDRHFKFLAFGNSQIREHGAYFYCENDYQTCDDIRSWMGDFSHIKVVAKYASRLGQCFSTTRAPRGLALGLSTQMIEEIENNGLCFSDGVGIISQWLANEITKKLRLFQRGKVPSAFQFRLGGNKGILVTWQRATFNQVLLRPSQNKFTSQTKALEIIRSSRFSVATLNRQTILLLSCLGVPDEVFVGMTKEQLSAYTAAMADREVALKLLGRFVDENGVTTTIAQMIEDHFMDLKEPFTKAILQLWRAWSMKLLREKARIVVEKGAFVLGCVDETHTLRGHRNAGEADKTHDRQKLPQIFLQVPHPEHSHRYQVVTGVCVVGRNPSLHPGDLRVVEAVDTANPDLRSLRDVVVFPADGDRDIASMCSGGDLDGDDYFVFWDERLIPQEWNYPPMEHDATSPKVLNRDVNIKDVAKFFVEYMKNDSLSTVALAHVAQSDWLPDGPKHETCIQLARLHSDAVDYVKTGRRVHIPDELRPQRWPHFMERQPSKSYHSRSVIGQLYDLVAKIDFTPDFEGPFDERILRRYNLTDEMLSKARVLKAQYDMAMRQIMAQREIRTEFEVWSTFVMSKPRVGSEYKMQEDMGVVMLGLRDRFVEACIEHAGVAGENEQRDLGLWYPFIAAIYRVTWEEVQIALEECRDVQIIAGRPTPKRSKDRMPLISFPWIFEHELGRIATGKHTEEFELQEMPMIPRITRADSAEQALSLVVASVGSRLFHRGVEISVALGDMEASATDLAIYNSMPQSKRSTGSVGSESSGVKALPVTASEGGHTVDDMEGGEDEEGEVEVAEEGPTNNVMSALQRFTMKFGGEN